MAAASAASMAQPGGMGAQAPKTVVNKDNTVTFSYSNRNAKDVKVWTQFSNDVPMTKGANGVWTATVGPANPDIYPYHFTVDGISVMDPQCAEWFPNETFKNSLLDMRAENSLAELKDIPHGSVDYLNYWSPGLNMFVPVIVYTPPFYDQNKDKSYPVMYLISGTTDTEEVYFKVGKMNLILDNLIAQGKAKEMILVLPYGNATLLKTERQASQTGGGMGGFGGMGGGYNFNRDFTDVLMPFVEKNYRTINDAQHRGIGGFSRGGNQGLSIGLANLDKFSYLCSYSSFTQTSAAMFADKDAVNAKINLFWLGIGTDDFLYGNSKDLMDILDRNGIKNKKVFTYDKYGHTWMNARYWLEKSFPLLFQDKKVIDAVESMDLAEAEKVREASAAGGEASRLTPALMGSLFPPGVKSPEYNADGSVTFRCQAPDAQKVELECQMFSGTKPMEKDSKGVWTITVKPDVPDIYPYAFQIDGTQVADPNNMHMFPNEGFKYSLCDVRGEAPSVQDIQDVPHGKVAYRYYFSKACGIERPMCVYTPAGYDPAGSEKLPVLYLIHGMTDTYETWFKVGQMNNIMDNLIAKGEAEKMIIVLPYGYMMNGTPAPNTMASAEMYSTFSKELTQCIMPFVEKNFRTLNDRDHRAIAGFSRGGGQSLFTALSNTDKFAWLGSYSAYLIPEMMDKYFSEGQANKLDIWMGVGREDFLYQNVLTHQEYWDKQGVKYSKLYTDGGHTWMNARHYLIETMKRYFKK